ncbi:EAL domain-containing protein [Thioalkalivibrio sp. ALE19]|uniref:EAL domain-containing protein n=1 Tax=Thioalkalivibrio sp. ALE19 TaxID=1266909 RepID=UPI00041A057D|nr:EAL domain-containing protein [Thioalkalivibrio sp. ALE19]
MAVIDGLGKHFVMFQPVVGLPAKEERVEYWEILSRATTPTGGMVEMADLLGTPQRILQVDCETLRIAIRQIMQDDSDQRYGVNIGASTLLNPEARAYINDLVRYLPRPERLVVEITEDFPPEPDHIGAIIHELERLHLFGVHIALDDFGTGGAGLAIFSRLPFDYVKFSPQIHIGNDRGRVLVDSVIQSAEKLHQQDRFSLVIEGVEDPAVLSLAEDLGINHAQGFLLGHPAIEPRKPRINEYDHNPTSRTRNVTEENAFFRDLD